MHMITMTSDWLWDRRYFVPTRHFVNYTITSTQLVNIPSLPDTWTFLENFDGGTPTVSFKAPSIPARGRGGKPLWEPSWKSVGGGGGGACTWGREERKDCKSEMKGGKERRERIVRVRWKEERRGEERKRKGEKKTKGKEHQSKEWTNLSISDLLIFLFVYPPLLYFIVINLEKEENVISNSSQMLQVSELICEAKSICQLESSGVSTTLSQL